jgi:hypothetical protein
MPAPNSYDYAIIRVVPKVERGECLNVGIVFFCRSKRYLRARIKLNENRLLALAPGLDLELIKPHLEVFVKVCEGGPDSGPIGQLSLPERFHWLVAPRSTIIQVSQAHSGFCEEPEVALEHLISTLVE